MKIDRYIEHLTRLRQQHGPGLQVIQQTTVGYRKAGIPRLHHRTLSNPNRRLFIEGTDRDTNKGEAVILLD